MSSETSHVPRPLPASQPSISILLANDDADALFLLGYALKRALPHAKIVTARDGREALAIWKRERLAAIVTDNRMPHLTGLELTRQIRQVDPHLPVIMATAATEKCEEAEIAGVTRFCPDSSPEALADAVKKCLSAAAL